MFRLPPLYLHNSDSGFTLIEVALVLVFTSIIAFSFPTFKAFNQRQAIQVAAKQVKDDIRHTQSKSSTGSTATAGVKTIWGIYFVPNTTSYQIFSCPASLVVAQLKHDCLGGTSQTKEIKSGVSISTVKGFPPDGGLSVGNGVNVIFPLLSQGSVLFHDNTGADINFGDPITTITLTLNIDGLSDTERREVSVTNVGSVEDRKPL